jgi:hypothetical protein
MADTVTAEYVYSGQRRKVLHLTGISDGTGESNVAKADISTLTFNFGQVPTYTAVDMIDYNIQGYNSIRLYWDHNTDDEIAILPAGANTIYFNSFGGKVDPRTTGGTGDILLTTNGHTSGATYDITIYFRPKN